MAGLSHAVLVLLGEAAQLPVEVDVDLEVEVALVAEVGPHPEDAKDLLALLGGDVVLQVEDGLLPVRVGSLRRCGEADPLVAFGELDVEEGHQGLKMNCRQTESPASPSSYGIPIIKCPNIALQ